MFIVLIYSLMYLLKHTVDFEVHEILFFYTPVFCGLTFLLACASENPCPYPVDRWITTVRKEYVFSNITFFGVLCLMLFLFIF